MSQSQPTPTPASPTLGPPSSPSPTSPEPFIPETHLPLSPDQDPTDNVPALEPRDHGLALRPIQEADVQRCSEISRRNSSTSSPRSKGSHVAEARLIQELYRSTVDPVPFVSFAPIADGDLLRMLASIEGPLDSPYEGGVFYIKVDLDETYPLLPPKCIFLTKILHPNISPRGEICMDVLERLWSPIYTLQSLLISICSLLTDPFFPDSFMPELEELYSTDRDTYDANIRRHTLTWARGVRPPASVFEEAGEARLEVTWGDYAEDSDGIVGLIERLGLGSEGD